MKSMIPLNLLIAEDNPLDAELLIHELRRAGYDPQWELVETESAYVERLRPDLDVILSDFHMPQFSGPRALELLQESALDVPFIIISGTIGEETSVEAMKLGATDYLLKDRLGRLGTAVCRAMLEVEERTERLRLKAQIIEAQKMEVVGHLASGVAHDFNNILAVIMGCNELVATALEPASPLLKFTEEISHASEQAARLTRQLLVFSRKQTVQPVVLDLNEVIVDLNKMLKRLTDEDIEIEHLPGDRIGRVKADSGYVGQVLMNLVVNARDAMPNGGKITIATKNITVGADDPKKSPPQGDYVILSVRDTGSGMTDEVKNRLFEAFFTTKPLGKGTGLGLATCQTIVQQCRGFIDVESELHKGTTFQIYFPRVQEPLDRTNSSVHSGPLPRGTETLLVVEDERAVRHLACDVLQAQGYEVLSAPNGKDALHVARAHLGAPISLVITDVVMPLMGGKIMAEWLQATYPDLKILFTSGYTDEAINHHGVLDDGIEFMPKPYTPATLIRRVREILDAPQ